MTVAPHEEPQDRSYDFKVRLLPFVHLFIVQSLHLKVDTLREEIFMDVPFLTIIALLPKSVT